MADKARHIKQALHNEDLLRHFSDSNKAGDFSDWCVTISFYAALHYVEALIFRTKKGLRIGVGNATIKADHSEDYCRFIGTRSPHHVRNILLRSNTEIFGEMYSPYTTLYEMSRTARYDCHEPNGHDHGECKICLKSVADEYDRLT